jgi:cobalt-zinc-cadmium efflux system protein
VRPLWASVGIIGAFFVVEVVGAILTGSLALLADSGHMLSDVAALALAIFAIWIAARPATRERTYGYHRVEVLAAGANATTLLGISLYIFWEAYQRMSQPPEVASGPMLVVAFAGLVANIAAAFVLHGGSGDSINMRGAFLHVLSDLLGSVGAIIAGAIMYFTGWYYADPLISVVIGLLVLFSGGRLLRDTVEILMEGAPRHIDLADMEKALLSLPGVAGVHDLHVWTVTSGFPAMSGHLKLSQPDGGRTLGAATELLRERFGIGHSTIQIEGPGEVEGLHQGCNGDPRGCGCIGTSLSACAAHAHVH